MKVFLLLAGLVALVLSGNAAVVPSSANTSQFNEIVMMMGSSQSPLTLQEMSLGQVMAALSNGDNSFINLIFNPFPVGDTDTATITVNTNNGTFSFPYPSFSASGQDILTVTANYGTIIEHVSITAGSSSGLPDPPPGGGDPPTPTPEPGAFPLLAGAALLGLIGVIGRRRRV